MTLDEVKNYYRTSYNFKKQTGMAHTNFYLWSKRGYVSIPAQLKIEKFTNGELKASLLDCPHKESFQDTGNKKKRRSPKCATNSHPE